MERLTNMETKLTERWSGPIPVNQVVWEAVQEFTDGDTNIEFAIKDVKPVISKKYPNFKLSNVGAEIAADCVNHPSRHYYSANEDRYWRVGYAKYRLFDPEKDKMESNEDVNQAESVTDDST